MSAVAGLLDIGGLIQARPGYRGGSPYINGTPISVTTVIALQRRGCTPGEIVAELYGVTLWQVHAALAYYFLNKGTMDALIAAEDTAFEQAAAEHDGHGAGCSCGSISTTTSPREA